MIQKKICMVGPVSVGKTSLVARFVHSLFSEKYLSTVGVKIDKKTVTIEGTELSLVLWDLAGDDMFQRLRLSYLRGAAGYLLVADGSRKQTLEQALDINSRIVDALGVLPCVLILNKSDLRQEWEVTPSEVQALERRKWRVHQTSAKSGAGVEEAFFELAGGVLPAG